MFPDRPGCFLESRRAARGRGNGSWQGRDLGCRLRKEAAVAHGRWPCIRSIGAGWHPAAAGEGEGTDWIWDRQREGRRPFRLEKGEATIWIWDWRTAKVLSSLVVPAGPVSALDWHADGQRLLAVSGSESSCQLRIFETASGKETAAWPTGTGSRAAFSPDGSRLFRGAEPVRVTELETNKVVLSFWQTGTSRTTWSPTGNRLASNAESLVLKIWDPSSGAVLASVLASPAVMQQLTWNPKGELLAAYQSADSCVRIWNTSFAQKAMTLPTPERRALSVAFSPDGKHLLVGADSGLLRMHDVETGKVALSVVHGDTWNGCVAWSPDGSRYACRFDDDVLICDAKTGEEVVPRLICEDEARSLAFSPDGRVLAVGLRAKTPGVASEQGRVKLFSAGTGKELAASPYAEGRCDAVAWRRDGNRLAAAGYPLRVFDASLRPQPFAATGESFGLDWSPDGGKLAAGERQGTVTIYDAATASRLHVLRHAPRFVCPFAGTRRCRGWPRQAETGRSVSGTRQRARKWACWRHTAAGSVDLIGVPNGWRLATGKRRFHGPRLGCLTCRSVL